MEKMNWNEYKTNAEITEAISKHASTFDLKKIQEDLSKDFVFQKTAIRNIYSALCTGSNVMLYGPGGFGKSAIAKAVCQYMELPIIYKVGYEGMTAEELLGVPDMQKLLNDSTYKVAFENSVFANPGILILEEFTDTGAGTAAALKDILTAGGFREGSELMHSLISTVIITGNKKPQELAVDDTTKAFYRDRFPMQHEVVWDEFTDDRYLDFFEVFFKDQYRQNFSKFRLLAKLCVNSEEVISPRIAAKGGNVMLKLGIDFLDTVKDIDTSELTQMKAEAEKEAILYGEKDILDNYDKLIGDLMVDGEDPESLIKHHVYLQMLMDSIREDKVSEENHVQYTTILKQLRAMINVNQKNFYRYVSTDTTDIFDSNIDKLYTHED